MDFTDFNYHGPVVAFDLDDTLFRERDYCRSGFRHIESLLPGLTGLKGEELTGLVAMMDKALAARSSYFDLLERWLALRGFNPSEYMPGLVAEYRRHVPADGLRLLPGAAECLQTLQKRGVVTAIITDGRTATQTAKLQALGIADMFAPENILISEATGHDKSSAEAFTVLVRRYPEASGFAYVADNPLKDFLHPNLLGWTTAGVPYDSDAVHPDPGPKEWPDAPSHTLRSLAEVPGLLAIK